MADTLRELVVSLSLQSDNFSKNIRLIQNQIKEAESAFTAAGAGVDRFATSTEGLKTKLGSLETKLTLQQQAVDQYKKALDSANTSLENAAKKHDEYKGKLETAKTAQANLKSELENATTAWNAAKKSMGENSDEANALGLEVLSLKDQYKAASDEVKTLEGQVASNNTSLQTQADKVSKATTNLNNAKTAYGDTESAIKSTKKALDDSESAWKKAGENAEAFGQKASKVGKDVEQVGKNMSMYLTAPLLALGGFTYKAAADYESAFAGVRKTTEGTEEDFAALNAGLLEMSERTPMSYTDLAYTMELAGQLGIDGVDNLLKFTETMSMLGVSTNLNAGDAASTLAKFANITGMSLDDVDKLGAVIVALGNNYATTEADIAAMAIRMASAGELAGLSETDILALSAALSSMGVEAEAGGSAAAKLMKEMQIAAETGDGKFADVMGLSQEDFKKLWDEDAAGAMLTFFESLKTMDTAGQSSAVKMLEDMGLSEIRLSNMILATTNNTENFASALGLANAAWEENTALVDEATKRYETQTSQNQILANKASNTAANFGDNIIKMMEPVMDKLNEVLDWFNSFDEDTQGKVITAFAIFAATGPIVASIGGTIKAIGGISTGIGKVIDAAPQIIAAMSGPAGWITLATLAAGGLVLAIANMKSDMEIIAQEAAAIELKIDEQSKNETLQAIAEVRKEIEGLSGDETAERGAGVVATVKAGYGTSGMYGDALGYESGAANKRITDAGANYQAQVDAINAQIVAAVEAGNQASADQLAAQREGLYAQWDADVLAIKEAYTQSVSELVTGMASQYPEAQARINDAMEQYSALKALNEYDPTEMTDEQMQAAAQKLLGMEGMEKALAEMGQTPESVIAMYGGLPINIVDALRTSLADALKNSASSTAESPINTVINTLLSEAGNVEGLNFSALDGSLADGIALLDFKAAAEQAQSKGGEIGQYLTTGLGTGISGSASATNKDVIALRDAVLAQARAAFDISSPSKVMASQVGKYIPEGVAKGIDDGTYKVKAAMVRMAEAALKAAKDKLKIESPSRVMRDQVGVMIPRGAVAGIEEETARQQKAVANAFRALVQPALSGTRAASSVSNTRNVTNSGTVSMAGANIYLGDKLDAQAFAYEIGGIQTSQLRALGGRA